MSRIGVGRPPVYDAPVNLVPRDNRLDRNTPRAVAILEVASWTGTDPDDLARRLGTPLKSEFSQANILAELKKFQEIDQRKPCLLVRASEMENLLELRVHTYLYRPVGDNPLKNSHYSIFGSWVIFVEDHHLKHKFLWYPLDTYQRLQGAINELKTIRATVCSESEITNILATRPSNLQAVIG